MNRKDAVYTAVFVICMLLFCLFMIFSVPVNENLKFQLDDLTLSLETSQGRERKQQHEYEEVLIELPKARSELETLQPLAEAARNEVTELKEQRKALRAEKEQLQNQIRDALQKEKESEEDQNE